MIELNIKKLKYEDFPNLDLSILGEGAPAIEIDEEDEEEEEEEEGGE